MKAECVYVHEKALVLLTVYVVVYVVVYVHVVVDVDVDVFGFS
jgi:hypothetical protein